MLVRALAISVLILQTGTAGSQERQFETSLLTVFRAVSRGEAKKALLYYENRARYFDNLAESSESPDGLWTEAARTYREASNAAHFLGNLQKAIDYGEKALVLVEKRRPRALKLAILSSVVWAHRSARNFTRAGELIGVALELSKEWPENSLNWMWWHGVFYLHRGQDFRRLREFEKAIEDFERVIQLKNEFLRAISSGARLDEDRKEHARTNMLFAYGGLGDTYLSAEKYDQALDAYQRGLDVAKEWRVEFHQSRFYIGAGTILHRRKDFTGALENFHNALTLAQRQQRPDVISNAARRIGDVLRDTGKRPEAIVFYRQAIEEIESMRALLASNQNRQSYFGGWLGAYQGMTEMLWQTGAYEQAFHYGERVRSRGFLDMLGSKVRLARLKNADPVGSAELSDREDSEEPHRAFLDKIRKADPEQASLMTVEPLTLKQVQALLEPEQTLLEYLVTPGKIFLWVVDKQRVRAVAIPLSQKELVARVEDLRTAISEIRPMNEYQVVAQDLYEKLITPAISFVRGKELIIVPHDVLHYLPFQALYSTKGSYLLQDYSVTYLSSASLLQFTTAKRKTVGQKILAVGNPKLELSKAQLPLAELEAKEIRKFYPEAAIFVGEGATEQTVRALSPAYDVLHFATHAELSKEDPLSSAILLTKSGNEDGSLEVRELFGMNLNASLVVLSGCETGLGQLSSGDELVGLTRAFIYAGTPSVVASLWKVDDRSTAQLMSGFYKNLKTMTKVEALRQAQLNMIRGHGKSDLLARRGVGGIAKLGETPMVASPSQQDAISTVAPVFLGAVYFGGGREVTLFG